MYVRKKKKEAEIHLVFCWQFFVNDSTSQKQKHFKIVG